MPINFPTSLDSLSNPSPTDTLNSPSHSTQHSNANDAIEALEAKVGIDGSAVTSSLDYKLKNSASTDPGHHHTSSTIDSIPVHGASSHTDITRYFSVDTGDFNAGGSGSAVLASANGGNAYAWLLDAGATEDIWATVQLPIDYVASSAIVPNWYWSMESSNSGNVVLQCQVAVIRDGAVVDSITSLLSHQQTVAVPTGASDTVKVTAFNSFTPQAGDLIRIRCLRLGGDGSDTATGDLNLYGVRFDYTANQ